MEKFLMFFYEVDDEYKEFPFDSLEDAKLAMKLVSAYHQVHCIGTVRSWFVDDDDFGSEMIMDWFDLHGVLVRRSTIIHHNGECVLSDDEDYL